MEVACFSRDINGNHIEHKVKGVWTIIACTLLYSAAFFFFTLLLETYVLSIRPISTAEFAFISHLPLKAFYWWADIKKTL